MFDELHRIRGLIGEKVVAGGGGLSLQDDDDFAALQTLNLVNFNWGICSHDACSPQETLNFGNTVALVITKELESLTLFLVGLPLVNSSSTSSHFCLLKAG